MKQMPRILFILTVILFSSMTQQGFASPKTKRVYLATYPRSGNHWSCYMLEEATHIATGSVYQGRNPKPYLSKPFEWGFAAENGYEGNCRYAGPQDVVVVKTHYPAKPLSRFDLKPCLKVIRIIRHPVDSFYSHLMYQENRELDANGKVPRDFIERSLVKWIKFMNYWDKQPNVVTIYYEDMLKDPYIALKKMLQIGRYKVKDSDIRRAVEKHPPQGEPLKHIVHYYPEDLQFIEDAIGDIMKKHGYSIPKQ